MKEAETINQLDSIQINFEPAKVAFSDFGAFETGIEQAIAKYGTFDLEVNTIEEVKQARTDLNKLSESLEKRRKEIKGKINEPYAEFEKAYKAPYSKLKGLIDTLKQQIDGYEENQKVLRKDAVRNWFKEKALEGNLNPEIFEQYLDSYTKAGQFKKDSFQILKKTEAELEAIVLAELQKQNQKDQDISIISSQCATHNIGPATYIRAYESGQTLAEVLDSITADIESAKLFKERQEARERAEAERKAEIERIAKEQAEASIKAYDAETGEVINEPPVLASSKYVTTIKFWFDLEQAKQFKEWLDTHNIKFETVEGMKKC
jgi:hypothetical protein|uniref:DUF1351 domain-containing protein n=1 Tax=Siphoviridae sp. ctM4S20 TaxID=2825458 RepID=A0A8S5P7G5_9CAUD|nr:MAG TPA: Protein of unknown function (DUF1351) [Siphoviridae sp. ctM4S20]